MKGIKEFYVQTTNDAKIISGGPCTRKEMEHQVVDQPMMEQSEGIYYLTFFEKGNSFPVTQAVEVVKTYTVEFSLFTCGSCSSAIPFLKNK